MTTVVTVGVTDQSANLVAHSLTLKLNTFDFTLKDPAVVPALGDVVTVVDSSIGLNWTGNVSSLTTFDPVERKGHTFVKVAATNQDEAAASAAPFNLSDSPSPPTSYSYQKLQVAHSVDSTGAAKTQGSCQIRYAGLWPAMTFQLTSANQGYSAADFSVTDVTITWPSLSDAPQFVVAFGDPLVTMSVWLNSANAGVLPIDETKITDGAVTTPKLAANAVTADKIEAGSITADKLSAALVLASLIQAGADTQHVEMDANGLRAYDSSGNLIVNLPTDGSDATMSLHVIAQTLSVVGAAILQSASNEMALGSVLQLDSHMNDPTQAPLLAQGWDTVSLPVDATYDVDSTHYSRSCIFYDSAGGATGTTKTFWTVTQKGDGSHEYALELNASDRTVLRSIDLGPGGVGPGTTPYVNPLGVARMGSYVYVLSADKYSGSGGSANLGQAGAATYSYVIGFSGGPNEWGMGPYTMPEHGTITSISVDCGADSGTVDTWPELWDGTTGTLVWQGSKKTLSVGHSRQTWSVPSLDAPSGSKWYIGIFQANSAAKRVGVQNGGSLRYKSNQASVSAFTGTTTWTSPPAGNMQAYFTYTKVTAVTSYVVRRFLQSDLSLDTEYDSVSFPVATPVTPQLAADGTNVIVVDRDSSIKWQKYDAAMATSGSVVDTSYDPGSAIRAASAGNGDFGAWRMLVASGSSPGTIDSFDSTPTHQTDESFRAASPVYGLTYGDALGDGARYWSAPMLSNATAASLTKHSTWTWTTASSVYWVGYSWPDTNAAGTGTHDTGISPRASITMVRRAKLTITAVAFPGGGGVDDPNNINFFMAPNATDPGATNFHLQATQTGQTVSLSAYNSGGAADVANSYPSGGAAQIASQTGGLLLKGDGTAQVQGTDVPAGMIYENEVTSNQTGITAFTDLTGLSATWTAIAGRRYRTRVRVHVGQSTGGQRADLQLADGSNNPLDTSLLYPGDLNGSYAMEVEYEEVPGAGSVTRKARLARGVGAGTVSMNASASLKAKITVEDIGT